MNLLQTKMYIINSKTKLYFMYKNKDLVHARLNLKNPLPKNIFFE